MGKIRHRREATRAEMAACGPGTAFPDRPANAKVTREDAPHHGSPFTNTGYWRKLLQPARRNPGNNVQGREEIMRRFWSAAVVLGVLAATPASAWDRGDVDALAVLPEGNPGLRGSARGAT